VDLLIQGIELLQCCSVAVFSEGLGTLFFIRGLGVAAWAKKVIGYLGGNAAFT
jgi:hypothetical protein